MRTTHPRREHFLVRYLGIRVERSLRIRAAVPKAIVFASPGLKGGSSLPEPALSVSEIEDLSPAVQEFGEAQS